MHHTTIQENSHARRKLQKASKTLGCVLQALEALLVSNSGGLFNDSNEQNYFRTFKVGASRQEKHPRHCVVGTAGIQVAGETARDAGCRRIKRNPEDEVQQEKAAQTPVHPAAKYAAATPCCRSCRALAANL